MTAELPSMLQQQLRNYGISIYDEVTLRQLLEQRVETYTLIKLAAWPARRWKCQYRLMMGAGMYDAQSVSEAYAYALLSVLQQAPATPEEEE